MKNATHRDPYLDWCTKHVAELRRHPNQHVAIHLKRGVVVAAKTDAVFGKKLNKLGDKLVSNLFLTHTSLYRR